jgi:hypothetical protein
MAVRKLPTEDTGAKKFSSADDATRKALEVKRRAAASMALKGKSGWQEFKDLLPGIGTLGGAWFGGIKGAGVGKKAGELVKGALPGKDTKAKRAEKLREQSKKDEAKLEGRTYQSPSAKAAKPAIAAKPAEDNMLEFMKLYEKYGKDSGDFTLGGM